MFSFQGKNSRRPCLSSIHQPDPKSLTSVEIVSMTWRVLDQAPSHKEQKQGENEALTSNTAAWNSCHEAGMEQLWGQAEGFLELKRIGQIVRLNFLIEKSALENILWNCFKLTYLFRQGNVLLTFPGRMKSCMSQYLLWCSLHKLKLIGVFVQNRLLPSKLKKN